MQGNRITKLFGIQYPLIQAGMIWCSGWELASAVSNAGGLGIIGSGSMYPEVLKDQVRKCKLATQKPFAVNIPLLYPDVDKHLETIVEEGVKIVFTSAGNPAKYTPWFKERGITVVHVVSSSKFAVKSETAGCDAVVAEGFEAGGHNGREETTTLCLIPKVADSVSIPVIAAGGIYDGRSMLAAMVLGAEGVQVGSRFVASLESSGHNAFKEQVIAASEGDTMLTLKDQTPARLLKNPFFAELERAYERCAGKEEVAAILGRGRAKKGMFEGDLVEGELEIGQCSANFNEIKPAAEIVKEIIEGYRTCLGSLTGRFSF
jgi:enoyl-[acyl-carrier protein] reductase II